MFNTDPIEYDIQAIKQDAKELTKENAKSILPALWIEVNRLQKNLKRTKDIRVLKTKGKNDDSTKRPVQRGVPDHPRIWG